MLNVIKQKAKEKKMNGKKVAELIKEGRPLPITMRHQFSIGFRYQSQL